MTVFQILVFRNNAWIKLRIMFVNALNDLQEKIVMKMLMIVLKIPVFRILMNTHTQIYFV